MLSRFFPNSTPKIYTMDAIIHSATLPEWYTEERCHISEIRNSADNPAVSIARARVEPGVTTALHAVIDTVEKYFILDGKGEMEINGLPVGEVKTGDLVVIPAGAPQRIRNTGTTDLLFLCICTPRFETRNYQALE